MWPNSKAVFNCPTDSPTQNAVLQEYYKLLTTLQHYPTALAQLSQRYASSHTSMPTTTIETSINATPNISWHLYNAAEAIDASSAACNMPDISPIIINPAAIAASYAAHLNQIIPNAAAAAVSAVPITNEMLLKWNSNGNNINNKHLTAHAANITYPATIGNASKIIDKQNATEFKQPLCPNNSNVYARHSKRNGLQRKRSRSTDNKDLMESTNIEVEQQTALNLQVKKRLQENSEDLLPPPKKKWIKHYLKGMLGFYLKF